MTFQGQTQGHQFKMVNIMEIRADRAMVRMKH